jgi:ATP:ADP antiporter, AAA family
MDFGAIFLKGLGREQRIKAALLSSWFFLTVATLWILKPVRVASLLVHLGSTETPYVRLASVATMAVVVMGYSHVVNRLSRIGVVRWANLLFVGLLIAFWVALQVAGEWLGAQRPFVWSVYILVEIYSVMMIGIFWTYTNDISTEADANKLYGTVGLGGIVGGVAGGAFVDAFARPIGPVNLLLVCAGLVVCSTALGSFTEAALKPPPRQRAAEPEDKEGVKAALEGALEVKKSRYLLLLVGIVVAYEFTATLTDFGVSVIFERTFSSEIEMTKMYGRLGWIVSATAIVAQLVLVPLLMPSKRTALLVAPVAMMAGAMGALIFPVIGAAFILAAADRGLNYSIQQAVKESLYVPLSDAQKYKAKAFIDMFVDRAAKALAAFALIGVIQYWGASVRIALGLSFASMAVWLASARGLGTYFLKGRMAAAAPSPVEGGAKAAAQSGRESPIGEMPPKAA